MLLVLLQLEINLGYCIVHILYFMSWFLYIFTADLIYILFCLPHGFVYRIGQCLPAGTSNTDELSITPGRSRCVFEMSCRRQRCSRPILGYHEDDQDTMTV